MNSKLIKDLHGSFQENVCYENYKIFFNRSKTFFLTLFIWLKQKVGQKSIKASNLHQTIYYKHYKYIAFLKLYFKQLPVEDVLETKLELLVLFMIGGINWKLFGRLRRRCSSDRNGRLGVNCQCRRVVYVLNISHTKHCKGIFCRQFLLIHKIRRVDADFNLNRYFSIYVPVFPLCLFKRSSLSE